MAEKMDLRPATVDDMRFILQNMREADRREYLAAGIVPEGLDPSSALSTARKVTAWGPEGAPLVVFGVTPSVCGRWGHPWAMATSQARRHVRHLTAMVSPLLEWLGQGFDGLLNVKDSRNSGHIRWLSGLGFQLLPAQPTTGGHQFHIFIKRIKQ